MDEEHRLLTLTKSILESFVSEKLSRFESLFILEAVKASLNEEVIKETVEEILKDNKPKDSPGIG
jgi:hypothetical protein|tara:strand:+ start:371 stop:565 length:195 start_codon:yes stop_codon:yes gene_type:complete